MLGQRGNEAAVDVSTQRLETQGWRWGKSQAPKGTDMVGLFRTRTAGHRKQESSAGDT